MDYLLSPIFAIYYAACNPFDQKEFDKKKRDDNFKQNNHQEILNIVNSHPLEVLNNMKAKEIDQLAKRLAELLKNSLFTYSMTEDFIKETNLVRDKLGDGDYRLSKRFRSSFEYYIQDLHYAQLGNSTLLTGYMFLFLIHWRH